MALKPIYQASVSDVHLGHRNTTVEEIIASLERAFPDDADTAALDIIWIAGDLFDQLLNLADSKTIAIRYWAAKFLRQCAKNGTMVRALEGTPLHDWQQTRLLETVNRIGNIGCDFRYVDKLDIEYIEKHDIHVLYVPDEWRTHSDDTWADVVAKLAEWGLDKVDYAIMHGSFPHQLPNIPGIDHHNPDRYLSIVRKYIFIGHIHQQSAWDRILAQGSLERLCHGDEGDKGHYRVRDMRGQGPDQIRHVINTGAKIYRTIDCRGLTIEEVYARLEAEPNHPAGSCIRIYCNKTDLAVSAMPQIEKMYPQYSWSLKKDRKSIGVKDIQQTLTNLFVPVTITKSNVTELLLPRLDRIEDPFIRERSKILLQEAIENGYSRT